ncbi:MAG: hypothetical protein KJ566_01055 [Nanoarchaeota archaeon]|nr:hypothetical protein [Nanoarchaeota archaeon]
MIFGCPITRLNNSVMYVIGEFGRDGAIELGLSNFRDKELTKYYDKLEKGFNYIIPSHEKGTLNRLIDNIEVAKEIAKA